MDRVCRASSSRRSALARRRTERAKRDRLAEVQRDDPDRDVLPAALAGDLDAFEELVRRYQARIVRFVRTLIGRAEDAEDLAQEVFVRAHKALSRFRGQSWFRTWLYTVATNVARTHRQSRKREEPIWVDSGHSEDQVFDPPDLSDFEATWLTRDTIERALDQLPQELRVAVTLRDVHGLEYRDIAETMGVPIGTVESRIFRARQRLRSVIGSLKAH